MIIESNSPQETRKLGARLGEKLLSEKNENAPFVFSLEGDLGSGKTTFIKGLAAKMGAKGRVKSPSFVLTRKYELDCPKFQYLFHIDCYRLSGDKADLDQIAFEDMLKTPNSIVVIEWGEKIETFLPEDYYKIKFSYLGEGSRKLELPSPFFSHD